MAIQYDLEPTIKGDTFRLDFSFYDRDEDGVETVIDLTGASAEGQVRDKKSEDGVLIADLDFVSDSSDLLAGAIKMYLSDTDTADIEPGMYYYSVKVTYADGDKFTHFIGEWPLDPRVTV